MRASEMITQKLMEIAASLWCKPATEEQLKERDFLKGITEYGVHTYLYLAEKRGWIYRKGEVWHTKKITVKKVLNPAGYELEYGDYRSDFEKAFNKWNKRI